MSRKLKSSRPREGLFPAWLRFAMALAALAGIAFWQTWRTREVSLPLRTAPPSRGAPVSPSPRSDAEVFATYAGSQSCRECHAAAFENWKGSHHGLAERAVDATLDHSAFVPARSIRHGTQTSEVRRVEGRLQLRTAGLAGGLTDFVTDRVIGEAPLRQFLIPAEGGRWQSTELAFDPVHGDWFDVYGNEDRRPGEWGHWTGRGMTWNHMCASCHNTRLRKNYLATNDRYATVMAEQGVGCESCHGPMAAHTAWQKGRAQPAKGDPTLRLLDREQMLSACAMCHARRGELTGDFQPGDAFSDHYLLAIPDGTDTYHADGQVRDENYEYTSFLSSRMHGAGVRCMDCHEPHSSKTILPGNALCLRCHATPVPPAPKIEAAHSHHQPGSRGDACIDCHMPQTVYMQRHPRHDHGFTIPDPLLTKQHAIPNACNRCHSDRDADWALAAVEKWYGPRMNRPTRTRAQTIAKARAGDSNAVPALLQLAREDKAGLWRASATRLLDRWATAPAVKPVLLERVGDADPLVRVEAARSLEPLFESGDPAAANSLRHLLTDPVRAVRVAAAGVLHREVDTNSPAGQELMREMVFNLDQPAGLLRFGGFLMDRGDPVAALPWLQRAVNWDSNSPPLRHGLAICLSANGRAAEATRELEAACRLAPTDANYRFQLALALNESGNPFDAVAALERTVKLDPRHAQGWYNLGLAYSGQGRDAEAIETLLRAESVEPTSPRAPYALATIHARLGQTADARRAAERALAAQPGFREAAQLLRQLSSGAP